MDKLALVLLSWADVQSTVSDAKYAVEVLVTLLAGVFGLIAALKIYNRWQLKGGLDITYDIFMWFAGSVFFLAGKLFVVYIF